MKKKLPAKSPKNKSKAEDILSPFSIDDTISRSYLSTGCNELNLGIAGTIDGGIPQGIMALIVGDSSAGKTVMGMMLLAEASIDPKFDDYQLIYDPAENGMMMDVKAIYGEKLAKRIQLPLDRKGKPTISRTVRGMYNNANRAVDRGPMVYILDSMDGLDDDADVKLFEENQDKDDDKVKASYGAGKARQNSQHLRQLCVKLKQTNSILVVISQTRQNIGFAAMFNPKTRSGGDALRFYNRIEYWLSLREKIKRTVRGKPMIIGQQIVADVKKNHVTGWEGKIEITLMKNLGIDTIGTSVDFMVTYKGWTSAGGSIKVPKWNKTFKNQEEIVQYVQANGKERSLALQVGKLWAEIQKACHHRRKNKYHE